jgi:mannobiose 2-epimerase
VLDKGAPKGIILNARILWTFSKAARFFKNERYLEIASRAYKYILTYFLDKKNGGVYWMVDHKGNPLHTKKQVYAQAFAIYALTEYHLATNSKESLDEAIKLLNLIEKYSFDKKDNGYLEAFDEQWDLLDDLRLSAKDANEKKTMNTHLHILEAYTLLYEAWKSESVEKQLRNLIHIFEEKIINDKYQYDLFFNEIWELQSSVTSFGHDIEGSWLLCEAANVLNDPSLKDRMKRLALLTVDRTISNGLDKDGGLMNETDPDGIKDSDKHWWPQAEAIVGLLNAWQLSGDEKYLYSADKVWQFIKTNLLDKENGEWYWLVDEDGKVGFTKDKAGFWKCPYHNGRMAIEVARRMKLI